MKISISLHRQNFEALGGIDAGFAALKEAGIEAIEYAFTTPDLSWEDQRAGKYSTYFENEYFWGGSTQYAKKLPISRETEGYFLDMNDGHNQTMPLYHNEDLVLAIVPMLAFCYSRLGDIDRNLSTIWCPDKLSEAATIINIHLIIKDCGFFRQIG